MSLSGTSRSHALLAASANQRARQPRVTIHAAAPPGERRRVAAESDHFVDALLFVVCVSTVCFTEVDRFKRHLML